MSTVDKGSFDIQIELRSVDILVIHQDRLKKTWSVWDLMPTMAWPKQPGSEEPHVHHCLSIALEVSEICV